MAQKSINPQTAKRYAQDYLYYLRKRHKLFIKSAYLFGSFASGKNRDWSDIDVCVISPKFKRTDPLTYLWTKLRDIDVERGIEPVGIHPKDFVEENPIAHEVKKFGVLLRTR